WTRNECVEENIAISMNFSRRMLVLLPVLPWAN
ncbi:hypothetical protein A2U01_0117204, partial [Trifolium medium]|nr:hypothetical protein [Trifolium medium]